MDASEAQEAKRTSRATSSGLRPASICFSAAIICASALMIYSHHRGDFGSTRNPPALHVNSVWKKMQAKFLIGGKPMIPAAQYLRMSTDEQQFSIENQRAAIEDYAKKNGFSVVVSYVDAGRSGVQLKHRDGLRRLLRDVISGTARYKAVLVYDISRWGRFQDCDESAHYEFLCRHAGVSIHYCAEQFSNDGTFPSSLLKALKRTMAGEYSRELGVKVFAGQRRLAQQGFRVGGFAGIGLRRMIVSNTGKKKQTLQRFQYKNLQTDRVILVPGPRKEIAAVREMFEMASEGVSGAAIAREFNRRGISNEGRRWYTQSVLRLLKNPKYCGCNVWGRTSQSLGITRYRMPGAPALKY
jgi:DNA invertase Pin-like site-specific DNA recombinase